MSSDSSTNTLSVPWKPWEAVLIFVLTWIGVPLFILSAFKYAAPYDPNINTFLKGVSSNDIAASFQLTVLSAIAGMGLIWLVLRKYKVGWSTVGLRKFNPVKASLLVLSLIHI